jgi:hypothetical protein
MPLKAKHIVEEINGVRCTIVEKGATKERAAFLQDLLTFNDFEVQIAEEPKTADDVPALYTVGVTDLVFNPVIAVYEMSLKTRDGKNVSPAYWEQSSNMPVDQYWLSEDEMKPGKSAWFYKEEK